MRKVSKMSSADAMVELVVQRMERPDKISKDIEGVATGVQYLISSTHLKYSTLVLLISESSGVGRLLVDLVLKAAANLREDYLKDESEVEGKK